MSPGRPPSPFVGSGEGWPWWVVAPASIAIGLMWPVLIGLTILR